MAPVQAGTLLFFTLFAVLVLVLELSSFNTAVVIATSTYGFVYTWINCYVDTTTVLL